VDDSKDCALILTKLLERCGYLVAFELSGKDALETAALIKPDVILVDLAMPDMDGYQLAQKLRKEAIDGKPKLVSLTGYPRGKGNGDDSIFDDYLLKPVDVETLRRVIDDGRPTGS